MATTVKASGNFSINTTLNATSGPLTIQGGILLPSCFVQFTSGNAALGLVDQAFATQLVVANGTAAVWNLNTMSISTVNSGTAPNDACGNAFAMLHLKFLLIQNLGYTGSTPVETDILTISGTGAATALLSFLMVNATTSGIILPGPYSAAAVSAGQAPYIIVGNPGATAYAVATSTGANELTLTSTASGRSCYLNLIAIGATA